MPLLSALYLGPATNDLGPKVQQVLTDSNISNSFVLGDDRRFIWFIYPGEEELKALSKTLRSSVGKETPIVVFEDRTESYVYH